MSWLVTTPAPLAICFFLYLLQAVGFWRIGQRGLALTHLAYAMGNVGLIIAWYEVRA